MNILKKIFGRKEQNKPLLIDPKSIVEYYYNTILESSLQGLKFNVKEGKIDKNRLSKVNIFFIKHREKDTKQYSDNLQYMENHIRKIEPKDFKKYKIAYFPFIFKFLQYSSTGREDKYFTAPIYFTFDLDNNALNIVDDLVSISLDAGLEDEVFKGANIVFNNLFASKAISSIYNEELEIFKEKIEDEEFNNKYPIKDFGYFKSFLLDYLDSSIGNVKIDVNDSYSVIIEKLHSSIKNFAGGFDKILDLEYKSAIALIDSEELLESDLMYKGIISAYKNSIIPFVNDDKTSKNKINKIFYKHSNKLIDKNDAFIKSDDTNTLDLSLENVIKLQMEHLGSFSSEFALTVSQRLSLCAANSAMDVVPVNGPPGTGKTALLRAVFSNYLVKKGFAAYKSYIVNKHNPFELIDTGKPILGTSSVKQAINNIISGISEGFMEASKQGLKYERWLDLSNSHYNDIDLIQDHAVVPQIRNSEEKYENDILFTGLDSVFEYIENLNGKNLKTSYLNKFNKTYSLDYKELGECIEYIHKKMESLKISIIKDVTSIDVFNLNEKEVFERLERLDKNDRFELFFTSLHLLESFFILNILKLNKQSLDVSGVSCSCPICDQELDIENKIVCKNCGFELIKDENYKNLKPEIGNKDLGLLLKDSFMIEDKRYGIRFNPKTKKHNVKELNNKAVDLNKLYIVSPLFPMLSVTMHSLFGAFKIKNDDKYIIEKDFFDLVLTDESGMILAPIALPVFYVAKKMIVVGDEKQIEPIYPFDKVIDKSIFGRLKTKINYAQFFNDYSILNLNFIKLINRSTYFNSFEMKDHEENSLWLKEHFRCKDEIIEYCNKIIYGGILIPKVREFNKYLFLDDVKEGYPAIKIFNFESEVYKNRSELEALAIADYLLHNIEELTEVYNQFKYKTKKAEEVHENIPADEFYKKIGIVTPFNNQKSLIAKTLPKEFNLKKILIGTVHAFQGSEKEIIIFSPVIDKDCNYEHFTNKDNGNMMNVAVSRAKSAFWVFGSTEGMKKAGNYTEVLAKYIDEKEDYEFADKSQIINNTSSKIQKHDSLKCPLCQESLIEVGKVFKCSTQKFTNGIQSGCRFTIFKNNNLLGRELNINDIVELLDNKSTKIDNILLSLDLNSNNFLKIFKENKTLEENLEKIKETQKTFRKNDKYIYKNFRGKDLTLEEAEKILNGDTIKVKRVSKAGKEYEINVSSNGDGILSASF